MFFGGCGSLQGSILMSVTETTKQGCFRKVLVIIPILLKRVSVFSSMWNVRQVGMESKQILIFHLWICFRNILLYISYGKTNTRLPVRLLWCNLKVITLVLEFALCNQNWILLFSWNPLNWSKVTVKTFMMLQMISVSNNFFWTLFIKESWKVSHFRKNTKRLSTLIITLIFEQ